MKLTVLTLSRCLVMALVGSLWIAYGSSTVAQDAKQNAASEAVAVQDDGFVPLFNGRDLTGWVLVNTPPDTWKIENEMLVCSGKPIGELRTEKMYQNFEMEVEWRHLVPKGNAGIFVWADDITARGVPFHRGIEVQVLEHAYGNTESYTTHGDIFPIHGATMTPFNGRRGSRAFPTEERAKPSPEWNHYRIVCNDGNISLSVNGKEVTRGRDCSPRKGYICIESEGGVVHYRNMRIKVLPDTPVSDKDVAIANRGYRSIYSGLDLRGWTASDEARKAWRANDWVLAFDGTVSASAAKLETEAESNVAGCVVDFRFVDKSEWIRLTLPGSKEPLTIRAKDDPKFASALVARGSWNRLEARRTSQGWHWLINGQAFGANATAPDEAALGKLAIEAEGPMEVANLYLR